jgi:REP element-mobilizing transposase RayT
LEPARRRATERLHVGRVSAAGAVYFVTFVTERRDPWLGAPKAQAAVLEALRVWHDEGDGAVLAATVMPDHVHVLFELGLRLDVGRCVARWKSVTRKLAGYSGAWQRDFWEHRVRVQRHVEEYALYIYLNPYRATMAANTAAWPGWWAPRPTKFRFFGKLAAGDTPPIEWLSWPDNRFAELTIRE